MHLQIRWPGASRDGGVCPQCQGNAVRIRHLTSLRQNGRTMSREGFRRPQLLLQARAMLALRWRRNGYLPASIREPAWDIMLVLYCGVMHCHGPWDAQLAELVGVSKSAAVRWIEYLEHHGLVERESAREPASVEPLKLTAYGRTAMDRIFATIGVDGE